jgi:hypothetical protein
MLIHNRVVIQTFATVVTLSLSVFALADTPVALRTRIDQLIEEGDIETALAVGIDAVTLQPDDPSLLYQVGRAAFRGRRYHLAIYYFNRSLHFRPNHGASLLYLGWAQKRADLSAESRHTFEHLSTSDDTISPLMRDSAIRALKLLGPEPRLRGTVHSNVASSSKRFFVAAPYAALLEYGGSTHKYGGETYQLDLRAGFLGRGYVELSEAWSSIETLPGYPSYEVLEHRLGLAGFVSPKLLLKGKYAFLDADYEGGGSGHFYALGADWLRGGRLRCGLVASYVNYPDGDIAQFVPRMTWRGDGFELSTALSVQQWDSSEGTGEFLGLIRQDLQIPFAGGDGISIGYAAGESRYGHAGFGDVLYSLPDKQTGSVYLRYTRPLYPFLLSLKSGVDTFETDEGDRYHSTAHTFSLGYLSRNARAPRSATQSPWTLSFGVGFRKSSATMTMSAADPLVTDLIDPVTFSDESGSYTSIYAYDLETGLSSKDVNSENRALAPYVVLRHRVGDSPGHLRLSLYGRYTFAPYSYEVEAEDAGYQRVWESYATLYDGTRFGGGRDVYASYNATQQGRCDLNLHELALGAETGIELLRGLDLAASGGVLLGVVDWSASDSTQWTESDDSSVLSWIDRQDSGQEFVVGLTAELHLRWSPSARTAWFIEASGGYVWYDDLDIAGSPITATFDLSSTTGTIGIGLR